MLPDCLLLQIHGSKNATIPINQLRLCSWKHLHSHIYTHTQDLTLLIFKIVGLVCFNNFKIQPTVMTSSSFLRFVTKITRSCEAVISLT